MTLTFVICLSPFSCMHILILMSQATTESEQEANGPQLAHLSEIASADMQMLCIIFPILSLQLIMKESSFKQVLSLKKKNFFFEEFFFFFFYHYFTIYRHDSQ